MARIAEDLLLLLVDNPESQPRLDRSRLARVLAAALILDLAYDCRVRPALPAEPLPPGHLVALAGPVPMDPAVRPAMAMLTQAPITPAAAISRLRKSAEDDVLDQLLRTGQLHQIQLSSHRLRRNTYRWPLHDRARVDLIRAALEAVLFDRQRPDPVTAVIVGLLQRVDGFGAVLDLDETAQAQASARAGEVADGAWADSTNTAEVNLALTAAAVLPAVD